MSLNACSVTLGRMLLVLGSLHQLHVSSARQARTFLPQERRIRRPACSAEQDLSHQFKEPTRHPRVQTALQGFTSLVLAEPNRQTVSHAHQVSLLLKGIGVH